MPRIERVKTLQEWAGADRLEIALLLTDIIGSTSLAGRGDDKWIDILIQHFERARQIHDRYQCYEIKLIGDAYMAVFRTAAEAFEFAQEFIVDTGHPEIFIRVAIHLGRAGIVENDIYGIMVNKASRIIDGISRQRPRLMGDSCIAVSGQARPSIIAVLGKLAEGEFTSHPVDLKSFGTEPVWFYRNRVMDEEIRKRRAALSQQSQPPIFARRRAQLSDSGLTLPPKAQEPTPQFTRRPFKNIILPAPKKDEEK